MKKRLVKELVYLADAYIGRCTPRQISMWQDYLRALAAALPAIQSASIARQTGKRARDCLTSYDAEAYRNWAKQQQKIFDEKELESFADFSVTKMREDEEASRELSSKK